VQPDNRFEAEHTLQVAGRRQGAATGLEVPMYAVDALVRRSLPLQMTRDAREARGERDSLAAASA
jgi:hypothetical protein